MKKILLALVCLLTLNVSAQVGQEMDTLRITTLDNKRHDYIFGNIEKLDFSDISKVLVKLIDGSQDEYPLGNVRSFRFYNRWSNPDVLLKEREIGAYEGLYTATYNPFALLYMVSCLASDEMLGGGGLADKWSGIDLLDPSSLDQKDQTWEIYFDAIANVNNTIAKLGALPSDVNTSDIKHAHGEALFLRAFYYTQLASIFGPVPVVINNTWEEKMATPTAAAVWGQILLDLKNAITLMDGYSPTLTSDDSRVGKYAAEALLARSFLFYTGFYQGVHDIAANDASVELPDGSTLTKADVIAYINDCVNNSGFSLVQDYRNLWPYTNRLTVDDYSYTKEQNLKWVEDDGAVNPEVLFKIKYNKMASWYTYTSMGYANKVALYMGIRGGQNSSNTFPFGQGWGAGTVSSGLYDDWAQAEPNDIRRDASIQNVDDLPNYRMGGGSWLDMVQETKYHEKKNSPVTCKDESYWDGYSPTFEGVMYGTDDWPNYGFQMGNIHPLNIIRLADVLLMQSELTGTVEGINKVRERAGLSALSTYSLAALQNERRWELAFEGVRWNDMRRWGDDYCKAALDKQMDIEIYNQGNKTTNPLGVPEYDRNPTGYSQRYAVNHGFYAVPEVQTMEGGEAVSVMQGEWTYQSEELMLDYIYITNDKVYRYDGDNNLVVKGTLSITKTDDFANRICSVTFTDGSMLPVSKNSADNEGTMQYDLISLDENTMTLTCSKGTLTLRRPVYSEQTLRVVADVQWSWAVSNQYNNQTDANITIGSYGLTTYDTDIAANGSLPIMYGRHVESVTAENLQAYLSGKGVDVSSGEADPFAYMTLSMKDKKIRKYKSDGTLISEKSFTAKLDDYQIVITTEPNAALIPYLYNDVSKKEVSFVVRANPYQGEFTWTGQEPGLVLTSVTKQEGMWTYWMFGRRGLTSEELESKLTVTQQDENGNAVSNGRFLKVSLDVPYDYGQYLSVEDEDGSVVPEKSPGVYVIKAAAGETLIKKLRFHFKNCNQIEAVTERTFTIYIDHLQRFWIYGENAEIEPPFVPGALDAAAMRFSSTEGRHFPTLSDEVYFGHKTLIFDVSDVNDAFDLKVMNGWWSNTYYDHVKWQNGLNELQITDEIARECAKGGEGRDLVLMLYSGTCTIKGVYYEE